MTKNKPARPTPADLALVAQWQAKKAAQGQRVATPARRVHTPAGVLAARANRHGSLNGLHER